MRNIVAKLATATLIIIGLVSVYVAPQEMARFRFSTENNETLIVLDQIKCLESSLPDAVNVLGSLPQTDVMVGQPENWQEYSDQLRRLFLARYAFTPRLIAAGPENYSWAVGIYKDQAVGLQALQSSEWQIVQDCENGIFLLKR